jgi:hypothetical protein
LFVSLMFNSDLALKFWPNLKNTKSKYLLNLTFCNK